MSRKSPEELSYMDSNERFSINSSSSKSTNIDDSLYEETINFIAKEQGLIFEEFLERGSNGAVASMLNSYSRERVAVKIEPFRDMTVIESWMKIKHPNVVSLIAFIPVQDPRFQDEKEDKWTAYIMPLYPGNIWSVVSDNRFLRRPQAFPDVCRWITEIANAIRYLHRNGMYHLDLKLDNVLVGNYGQAVLADFTFLTIKKEIKVQKIGCPFPLQPPECLANVSGTVQSEMVDVWCLGMLALNLFTCGELTSLYLDKTMDNFETFEEWIDKRKELLEFMIQPNGLKRVLEDNYSYSVLDEENINDCSIFLQNLLHEVPSRRITSKTVLSQPFLLRQQPERFIRRASRLFLGSSKNTAKEYSLHYWE